jgi:hypothetical protein
MFLKSMRYSVSTVSYEFRFQSLLFFYSCPISGFASEIRKVLEGIPLCGNNLLLVLSSHYSESWKGLLCKSESGKDTLAIEDWGLWNF